MALPSKVRGVQFNATMRELRFAELFLEHRNATKAVKIMRPEATNTQAGFMGHYFLKQLREKGIFDMLMEHYGIGVHERVRLLSELAHAQDTKGNPDNVTRLGALKIAMQAGQELQPAVVNNQVNVNIQTWADVTRLANEPDAQGEEAEFEEMPDTE